MRQFKHKKNHNIYDLIKVSTEPERGFKYYYLRSNENTFAYGSKAFKEIFVPVEEKEIT